MFPAACVLLRVHAVCLRGVCAVTVRSKMKRGKKAEEAAADGDNDTGSGTTSCAETTFEYLLRVTCHLHEPKFVVTSQRLQRKPRQQKNQKPQFCMKILRTK